MDIDDLLKQLDLEQYLPAFKENEVDIRALPHLSEDDLKDLGLPLGPRRRLQNAIKELQPEDSPGSEDPDEPVAERRQVTILFATLQQHSHGLWKCCGENGFVGYVHVGKLPVLMDRLVPYAAWVFTVSHRVLR